LRQCEKKFLTKSYIPDHVKYLMWMKIMILQHLMMIKMTVMIQKALNANEAEMEDSEKDVSDECNTDDEKTHD
jgi:hypothetical protein